MNGGSIQPTQACRASAGFTLIELIVCIGVILILIGLLVPSLARAFAGARGVRNLAGVQQATIIIAQYQEAFRECYPLDATEHSVERSFNWTKPIIQAGIIRSNAEVDPEGLKRYGELNVIMSQCMTSNPDQMTPGNTVPAELRRPFQVRMQDVTWPSAKGVLRLIRVENADVRTFWCCIDGGPRGPVSFADGSAAMYYWRELLPNGQLYQDENGVGAPVTTTWGGCRGRDRQK